jgi:LysM repeat protein
MKNLLIVLFLLPLLAQAQSKPLVIQGTTPDLYLLHTTGPKESFYSIGRIYNISPKVFAPYNQLVLENGLTIGQVVKIPLNEVNFSQDGMAGSDEALIPLYHKIKPKETLYNVSTTNNKVPVTTLKKWNKLGSDAVPNGGNMIVGYLKVKKELSPLAGGGVKVEPVATTTAENKTKENDVVEKPVIKKEEPVKEMPAKAAEPVITKTTPVKQAAPGNRNFNGGTFKNMYLKQSPADKEEKGSAGIFKSTSGWEDGKYYCLHNTAPAGTIVKITNPANQRAVYAKVLDVIPDIRQNEGMLVRLSNAAADELGVTSENFECTLNF